MAALAELNIPCFGATCSIDTIANGFVEGGGFTDSQSVDETTVGQYYQDTGCTMKATGTIKVAWPEGAGAPAVATGEIHALVLDLSSAATGNTALHFSGNVRFHTVSLPILDKKNAAHIEYSWTSQGAYTR